MPHKIQIMLEYDYDEEYDPFDLIKIGRDIQSEWIKVGSENDLPCPDEITAIVLTSQGQIFEIK